MDTTANSLIGVGLYTVPEAARLTRVPPAKIRGWINGYGERGGNRLPPIIHRQVPTIDGKPALGFLDLIEVRFVNGLVGHGVGWRTIRAAVDRTRQGLHHEHPFAPALFHADGVRPAVAYDLKLRSLRSPAPPPAILENCETPGRHRPLVLLSRLKIPTIRLPWIGRPNTVYPAPCPT